MENNFAEQEEISAKVQSTLKYLSSADAMSSLERDPYWPKWNSPWWHMLLLYEMGLVEQIPSQTMAKMVEVLKKQYLKHFPIKPEEMPPEMDPVRHVICHCALGSIYLLMSSYGIDVDTEFPWMQPWMLRYQLPDGGLNCDERAYLKEVPKSSLVSTLPCLEAILFSHAGKHTPEEYAFLNKGAEYLLRHRLLHKETTGEIIDSSWRECMFPRFYDYDFLRGFYFLVKWREFSGFVIPDDLVDEVENLIGTQLSDNGNIILKGRWFDKRSYNVNAQGEWEWQNASYFALLQAVCSEGKVCPYLTKQWKEVKPNYAKVNTAYECIYTNPIKLTKGEKVLVERRETEPEWLGWVFCRDKRGVGGWVSERYLLEKGAEALALKDYDATELSVVVGEIVKIYYEESGWSWCKGQNGKRGWLPTKVLTAC